MLSINFVIKVIQKSRKITELWNCIILYSRVNRLIIVKNHNCYDYVNKPYIVNLPFKNY